MTIDSTAAALLGAIIGGLIGVVGTLISTWATFKQQTKSFNRNSIQKHIDDVISAYAFSLNVFFNIKRDGFPDRATYGDVYAKISLFGSDEVKSLVNEIIVLPSEKRKEINVDKLINSMTHHIKELEEQLN
jgi:hypothetical protein